MPSGGSSFAEAPGNKAEKIDPKSTVTFFQTALNASAFSKKKLKLKLKF